MTTKTIKKAYKYRIYPNAEQADILNRTFGCCRYMYNYGLAKIKDAYEKDKTIIKINEISKMIPDLKKDEQTSFLGEVSSIAIIYSLRNLDAAFKNFFRQVKKGGKAGYPTFKSKYDRHQSFQFHQGYSIDFEKGEISIPKAPNIKALFHRKFDGITKTCTVSKTPTGKYFISILVEEENQVIQLRKKKEIVVHLGLRNFAYLSTGEIIKHPAFLMKSIERLKVLSRRFSVLKNKSKANNKPENYTGANIEKARIKLALLHEHVANQRANFLHNLSADIVKKHGYTTIIVENWEISEMIKQKYIAKQIADSGWRTFWGFLEYKSEWSGVEYKQVEKKSPTSKQCNECGTINNKLRAKVIWTCECCGTIHDREQNALNNMVSMAI